MKKLFVLFILILIPFVSKADDSGRCGENLRWVYDFGHNSLTISGTGDMYNYNTKLAPWYKYRETINQLILENGVSLIGNYAFCYCSGLTSVTIGNSVTRIGEGAFYKCSSLTSITIPNSVTSIGNSAFYYCSGLTSITIPNSVTSIGNEAFQNCSGLTSVTIGNSVTSIGNSAFYYCSGLTSITIPNSVTSIGGATFMGCSGLTSITIPNSVTNIGNSVFFGCSGLTSITIPNSVTSIGNTAFEDCSGLTSITIPNSVTSIGNEAFRSCSGLTSVTIGNSVTSIGDGTFSGCNGLASITIPNSVTSIGDGTFSGCNGLASITIPNSVTNIGSNPFYYCNNLTSITVSSGNTKYDSRNNCNAIIETSSNTLITGCKNTVIPNSVTSIGNGAFGLCNGLISITIPNSVTSIGSSAFYYCLGLTSITIPNSVTSIGNEAFRSCSGLTSVTIGNSVTSIGEVAFHGCSGLTTITIPNSVTSIGNYAFEDCSGLQEVKSEIINPYYISSFVFHRISSNAILYVPKGTKSKYEAFFGWTENFKEIIESSTEFINYALSIEATGNGFVSYKGTTTRNETNSFTVDEGTSATIIITPDNGNSISSVKLNNSDITSQISGNSYTISNITANTTLAVTFQEDVNALTVDGLNYTVTSQSNKTVTLTSGGSGLVLTVPATITQNGTTWKVTDIDKDALKGNTELAAIIWNPEAAFTATVSNPNLLLYVKSSDYAPATIQNVVVNGTASNIVLAETQSGNNFYCPQSFVAQKISYTHNYQMQTGIGEARGWETIALPFDVQTINHATKGTIKPFANWKSGDTAKPFWLMELTGTGFVETGSIKAYTPYIISMPNNPQYDNQWLLNGKVTFAASGVTVGKTEQLQEVTYKDRTFIPCYVEKGAAEGFYALNVSNEYETNNSGMTDGSRFVLNMRKIHPFEAYMTTSSNAPEWSIGIFEDMTTGIQMMVDGNWTKEEVVYDLQGRKVNAPSKKGVYIINGKKKIIK